jgi:hypothetical protein
MSLSEQLIGVAAAPSAKTAAALSSWIGSLAQRITRWANTRAERRAAAALYEHFNGLSDAELRNRELSRDTLGELFSRGREFP